MKLTEVAKVAAPTAAAAAVAAAAVVRPLSTAVDGTGVSIDRSTLPSVLWSRMSPVSSLAAATVVAAAAIVVALSTAVDGVSVDSCRRRQCPTDRHCHRCSGRIA